MPTTLTVRELPEALHARLQARAEAHQRSLDREVVALLEQALRDDESRQRAIARIDALRTAGPRIDDDPDMLVNRLRAGRP
ncbi:MAG: Arc family DNA-binding protein [Bacteroidota bacterium]